ncbi:hypothetical protein FQR65_LT05826 [Abscondita terminalis]|nr:hypothetical protein FQR65_LT05826 [Abscondita terminalis]
MAPKLYIKTPSPPARAVLVTAAAIGLELDLVHVEKDFLHSDEYLQLNPQGTIPTLVDNEVVICDSHVISTYLIEKYGKDDLLYPRDLEKRVVIDQRLYYDTGVIFPLILKIGNKLFTKTFKDESKELQESAFKVYDILEKYLEKTEWLAGDYTTLADISCSMTIKSMNLAIPFDIEKHKKLTTWLEKVNTLSYLSVDEPYFREFKQIYESVL